MPTVSIYVSNEDYDKFRAIEKKSEFIHNALNSKRPSTSSTSVNTSSIDHLANKGTKLCKHGSPKGSCMHKEATRLKCNV